MADKEEKKALKNKNKAEKVDKKKLKAPKAGSNKHWFKDFRAELKKVIWPTKRQLAENTTVVISMVIIVAVIIFLLDLAFKAINGSVVKVVVDSKNADNANTTTIVNSVDTNNETVENAESDEKAE